VASDDTRKCPLCGAQLKPGSDICPNCETDTSLFSLDAPSKDLEAIKNSSSLDDLLASVLDDWKPKGKREPPKKEDLEDLDLDLPDEPPDKPKLELDILEEDILGKEEPKAITFECPECRAEVDENASRCPSCGALFAEGETFECPVCGSNVAIDAESCSQCGVRFVDETTAEVDHQGLETPEKAPPGLERIPEGAETAKPSESGELIKAVMDRYREMERGNPLLVGDRDNLQASLQEQVRALRSLVSLAKNLKVPVKDTQRKIAEATRRAKARDPEGAVKLAWGARVALEQSVALQIAQRLELVGEELRAQREKGSAFPVAEALLEEGKKEVQEGDVHSAFEKLQLAKEDMASKSTGHSEARYALQAAEELVEDVAKLGVRVDTFKELLAQGREALKRGDWETASQMAATAQEKATEAIRGGLAEEMKRAKQVVMELKMQGRDVRGPIQLLKQASASMKERSYGDALKYLKMFKTRIRSF
jgi:predicted RNA-binding Zn-ribbon protein involved in translation (DUF1610 family)